MPSNADATMPMEALALPALGAQRQIGDWLVQRRLGAGAMGEVWLAQRGERRAALKVMGKRYADDKGFAERFRREIALLKSLDHGNIAAALDGGELDGRPWLAMEFVDGPDLDGLLKQHGPFFEADVLGTALQIARGLEHIHRQAGLIHRDVKPANVLMARAPGGDHKRLLNPGDTAKLIDFGLARPIEQDEGSGLTVAGTIIGTPSYIAPEQVNCEKQLTLHVDMYALGASMYHLLTGRTPYERPSAAAVLAAHLNDPIPDPGNVVPAISQPTRTLVMAAMAKTVKGRPADWAAFIAMAEAALAAAGEGNRFVRKPVVKPPTTAVPRKAESSAALPVRPGTGPVHRPITDVLPAANGSAALREAVSSRISKSPVAERPRPASTSSIGKPPGSGSLQRRPTTRRTVGDSAVSKLSDRLEEQGATGGSVLPWLVLGAAGLLAIGGAVWALLG